ncbi:MAG: ATP-binding protein [Spirochaetota bacterium]
MKKIRNKILVPIAFLMILLISVLGIFFNSLLKETYLNIIKQEMKEKIEFINIIIRDTPGLYTGRVTEFFSGKIKSISSVINMRITVVDHTGKVIADTDHDPAGMDNHKYRIEIKDSIEKKTGESIRYSNTLNTDMLYYAISYNNYIIRLAKPLLVIDAALTKLTKTIFLAGLTVVIAAVVIILLISNKITIPIRETRDFAISFSGGDYTRRIQDFSGDEIGILQRTLNRMAESIVYEMNLLELEQNKLKVTLNSISDGIAVVDNNKNIVIANRAFFSFLGIQNEMLNKIYYEVIRGSSFNKKIEYSLSHGEAADFREKFYPDRLCEISIIPIKEKTEIEGILIVMHDVTEKVKMDQLKTDLVGNLSHELKTPVAILKGYLETIQDNLTDINLCSDFIKKAILNLNRQDSIINDMLKLNMLETMTGIPFEPINLKEIINNSIEILNIKANAKEIEINSDIDILNRNIQGNKFLAEEIFFNIIINAINYTNPKGSINVKAFEDNGKTVISIADSGIGIPEESLGRIFERFYRVDKSRSRATGGTGLGLSIVKHAVEILNWEIGVESGGNGTVFFININS